MQVYSVSPDRGPSSGGTLVTVSGANLTSAANYPGYRDGNLLCRFGGPRGKTVPAKPATGSDTIVCATPPNPRDDAGTEVRSGRDRADTLLDYYGPFA